MRLKYLTYETADITDDNITFGQLDLHKPSIWQLVKIEGLFKSDIKLFKNETIDSQERIFKGNRLSERAINMRVVYQVKEEAPGLTYKELRQKKENDIINLMYILETTGVQNENETGNIILETINGTKFNISNCIVESIEETDSSLAQNTYIELNISIKALNPYIERSDGQIFELFDLSQKSILTDFVQTGQALDDTKLNFILESTLEHGEGRGASIVRDGYISDDGIFFGLGDYFEDVDEQHNGQFWLTDSLSKTIKNKGVKTFLSLNIKGFCVNPKIVNNSTGRELAFDSLIILEGQRVEVDTGNQTANLISIVDGLEVKQDIRNLLTRESSWIFLKKGANDINVSASQFGEGFLMELTAKTLYEGIGV